VALNAEQRRAPGGGVSRLVIKKGRVPFGIDARRQGFYDYRLLPPVWKVPLMKEATTKKDTAVVPVLLTFDAGRCSPAVSPSVM
jgi:hypothetical protein